MADERDPKVSQRYRELGVEEPPRELDQSILAAARPASDRPHAPLVTPAARHRWYFSLAAAAIMVLAVAVTWHIEREQPDPETVVSAPEAKTEEPDPRPQAPEAPRELAREASPRAERQAAPPSEMPAQRDPSAEARSAPAPSAAPPPGAAADSAPKPMARPSMPGGMDEQSVVESPERWLERIAELRRQARHEEADKALADFRQRFPDYRIPKATLEQVEKH